MNSSSSSSHSSKVNKTYSKDPADLITINEKVNLTKDQHEVLNIICNTYQVLFVMKCACVRKEVYPSQARMASNLYHYRMMLTDRSMMENQNYYDYY